MQILSDRDKAIQVSRHLCDDLNVVDSFLDVVCDREAFGEMLLLVQNYDSENDFVPKTLTFTLPPDPNSKVR